MSTPTCADCKFCTVPTGASFWEGECRVVTDPYSGKAMSVRVARLDTWNGLALPCGYEGKKWVQKP